MRQINPTLLLALLISLLIFVMVFAHREENRQSLIVKEIQSRQKIAKQIIAYKKIWENRVFYEKNIKRFLRNLDNRHIKYSNESSSKFMKLVFEKVDLFNSKYILSTILNQNFKIKSLSIKRLDDSHLKIKAEVAY